MKPGGDAGLFVCAPAMVENAMRSALVAPTFVALIAVCGPAAAEAGPGFSAIATLLSPEPGNKACYVRSYDAAHLRVHPHQRITAMKFLLGVQAYDPKPATATRPDELVYYTFSMSVARRGDKRLLRTSGDCMTAEGISCVVDCDGGGLALDKMPPAGSLIVRLSDDGIRMFHDCDDEQGVQVKPSLDDKVFRLSKTSNEACKMLDQDDK
jgi:hypothetical protein